MYRLTTIVLMVMLLAGCSSNEVPTNIVTSIGNPSAEKVLKGDPAANIFMYKDIIYNAGVPWVDEMKLTKHEQVTEIAKQTNEGLDFENGTANQLKVGTKIFSVKERGDVLIAESEKGEIWFYNLVEG